MNLDHSMARRTDPASSHAAASDLARSGKHEGQCLAVLAWVHKHPGRTSRELAELSGMDRHLVAKRTADLEHKQLARKGAMRACSISGKQAVTWEPILGEPEQMRLGI
jgi:DNA-binding MarR family transcriptional regulator